MEKEAIIYVVLDERKVIQKFYYLSIVSKDGKSIWKIKKVNFDETKDFDNSIIINGQYLDLIHIGYSQVIDGEFIENAEEYENSLK